jgi:hypothetical protein
VISCNPLFHRTGSRERGVEPAARHFAQINCRDGFFWPAANLIGFSEKLEGTLLAIMACSRW